MKKAQYKDLNFFSQNIKNKKILEIGSGRYDIDKFFDDSNIFIKSDINPEFGHKNIDVTKMNNKNEYDVIICLNVLEHVFDFNAAISNIYEALKPNGKLFLAVPVFYPLHDEPYDYWRFSEHCLRKVLSNFTHVKIMKSGFREFPYNYSIICEKCLE